MNWSLYDARALERRLVLCDAPRDLAWRAAFLNGPATLARIEEMRHMSLEEVVNPSLIYKIIDRARADTERRPLNEETAAARAAAEPASRNEAKTLLEAAMVDIPPWPGFDRVAAMPSYLDCLDDLPRAVLDNALADCRNICSTWPSIAEIRLAAEPYLGQVMRRLWRLQEPAEDGPP